MSRFDELPEWVTVAEFADFYRVGKSAAYEFVRAHGEELGVKRFGRTIRIPRSALVSGNGNAPGSGLAEGDVNRIEGANGHDQHTTRA